MNAESLRNALINKMEDNQLTLTEENMIAYVPSDYHELLEYSTDAKLMYLQMKGQIKDNKREAMH